MSPVNIFLRASALTSMMLSYFDKYYVRPYYRTVSRVSNKDRILANGLKVVLERGYVGASVRDIVEAAGVPQAPAR
jgi:hypothetical protein